MMNKHTYIQIHIFHSFQNDVISCAQQVETLESQLASRMEQLQATVQSKTAVPTAQVYVNEVLCFETNLSTV